MSRRSRGLLFGLGVLLGLGGFGAFLIARQVMPGFLAGLSPQGPQNPWGGQGEAGLVYLSPVTAADLWQNSTDGQHPHRLTDTGGQVFDYGVSPDGREIVYSAGNSLNGLDLWLLPPSGGNPRRLLDCGADACSGPVFAPDGLKIAYSRRVKAENPAGNASGVGRIWLMTLQDATTSPLYPDAVVSGQDMSWSPDGVSLALYDPLAGAIRVHRLEGGGPDLVLPVRLEKPGGWTLDSKKLVFADYAIGQERPLGVLSEVDLATSRVSPAFTDLDLVDFDSPVFDPSGVWMAVAGQSLGEGSARSIWIVRLGNSESKPSIFVWDLQTRKAQLVAENAALPAWVR